MKKIWIKIKSIASNAYALIRKNAKLAVDITNIVKEVVESPLMDVAVKLTTTTVDDVALPQVRRIVEKVATEMAIAAGLIQEADSTTLTLEEKVAKIVEHLKSQLPDGRIGFWVVFAGKLTVDFSDGNLSLAEGIARSQDIFNEFYNK
jgi:hypothetical protein